MTTTVHKDITIATGGTTSEAVDLSQHLLSGIILPAEFDGTTLNFTGSEEPDGTFLGLYNTAGTQITMTVAASRHVLIEPETFAGVRYIKVVAGAQTGDTVATLVLVESP